MEVDAKVCHGAPSKQARGSRPDPSGQPRRPHWILSGGRPTWRMLRRAGQSNWWPGLPRRRRGPPTSPIVASTTACGAPSRRLQVAIMPAASDVGHDDHLVGFEDLVERGSGGSGVGADHVSRTGTRRPVEDRSRASIASNRVRSPSGSSGDGNRLATSIAGGSQTLQS